MRLVLLFTVGLILGCALDSKSTPQIPSEARDCFASGGSEFHYGTSGGSREGSYQVCVYKIKEVK